MTCWYCWWGWAEKVAEIYKRALAALDGYESPLETGPSHIVWSDENFETRNVQSCLKECDNPEWLQHYKPEELAIVRKSLEELLAIPEDERCAPADYDDEHPENFPPTKFKTVKVK